MTRAVPVRLCAVFLTALQLLSSMPPAVAAPATPVPAAVRPFSNLSAIRIPETLGRISEFHQGAGPETFILVQDAHAIGETQQNIARILRRLEHKYGVRHFAVEGGEGAMDSLMLETVPVPNELKKELGRMIAEGELSGTVAAAISGKTGGPHFWGIEDSGLYEKEIRLYVENLSGQNAALEKIQRARGALQIQKEKFYPAAALKLDRWLAMFNREPLQHPSLIRKILKLSPPDAKRYPNLAVIFESKSRGVDSPPRLAGRQNIAGMTQGEVAGMTERNKPARGVEMDGQAGNGLKPFPTRQPTSVIIEEDPWKLEGARKEWDAFIRELYDRLLTAEEQKHLRQLSESLDRLENFSRIRLNAADWRLLQEQGIEKTLAPFPGLNAGDFDLARQFYETARQREQVFLDRLLTLSRTAAKGGPVVFVSGGFHADGLQAELQSRGASILVMSPHFNEAPDVRRYNRLMRGGQSWNRGMKPSVTQEFSAFHTYLLERLFPRMTLAQIKTWRDEMLRRLARDGRLHEAGFYTGIFDASLRKFLNSEEAGGLLTDAGKRLDSFMRALAALQQKAGLTPADLLPLFKHQNVSPRDKPLIRAGWGLPGALRMDRRGFGVIGTIHELPLRVKKSQSTSRSEMPRTRRSGTSVNSAVPRSEMRTDKPELTYKDALERFKQGDYDGEKGAEAWEKTPVEVRKRFVLNLAKLKTQKLRAEVSASQRERADRLQITLPQQGFKFETQAHQLVRLDFSGDRAIKFKFEDESEKTLESLYGFYEEKLQAQDEESGDGASHADHVINFMLHDLGLDRVERIRQWGRNVPEEKKIEKVTEFLEFLFTHEWDASTITFQPLDFERSVYDLLAHHARFFRSKWVVSHMNMRHFSKYGVQAELGFLTSFFAKGKLGTQFYPYLEIASVILALRKSEDFRREMNAEDFNPKTWNQSPADLQKAAARARQILNSPKIRRQTLQTGAARDLGTQEQQDFRRRHGIILGADLTQRIYSNLFRDDLEQVFYFQHILGRAYQELEHMEILRVLRDELEEVKERDVFLRSEDNAQPDYRIRLNALRQVEEVWTLHKNEAGGVIVEDRHLLLRENFAWPAEMSYEKIADLIGKKRGLYSALITQRVFSESGAPVLRVEIENSEAGAAQVKGIQTYVRQADGAEQVLVHTLYRQDAEFNPQWALADWRARAGDRQVPPPSAGQSGEWPTEWARSKSFKIGDKKQKGLSAEIVYFKPDAAVETVEDSKTGHEISVVTLGEIERIARSVFGPSDDEFYEDEHLLPRNAEGFLYDLQAVTGSSHVRKPEADEKEEFWAQHSGLFSEHFKSRTFFQVAGEFENPALKIELDPMTGEVLKIIRFKHDESGNRVSQDVWSPRQTIRIPLRSTDPGVLYQSAPDDAAPGRFENWNLETWLARLNTVAAHTQRTWFDSNGVEQLSLDLGTAASADGDGASALVITGARLLSGAGQRPVFTIHPDLLRAVPFQPRLDAARWREKLEPLLPAFSASGRAMPSAEGLEMLETAARKTVWAAYHDPKLLAAKIQAVRAKIDHERALLELALSTYQTYLETGHIAASATHELRDFIEKRIDPALEKWVGPLEGSLSDSWHTVLPRHMAFLMQSEIQRQLKFSDDKLAIIKLFLRPIAAGAFTPEEAVQFARLMTAAEAESETTEAVEEAEDEPQLAGSIQPTQPINTLADKLRWALETVSLTEGIYKEHLALLRMLGVDVKAYGQALSDLSPAKTPEGLAGLLEKNLFSLKTKGWLSALWTLDYVRHLELPVTRAYDAGSFLFAAAQAKPGVLGQPAVTAELLPVEIVDGEDHPVLDHLRANSNSERWNPAPVSKLEDASADQAQQGKYQLVTSFFRLQSQTPEQIAAFLKSARSLLQTGGHVLITLPAQLILEDAGLAQIKAMGFNIKQGFASNRLQDAAREILLKGRSHAGELDAAARAEAGIYGRGFYVLDLEKTAEAPALSAAFDKLVFTNWHHDVLVRDENPRTASERVLVSDDREQARVLARIRPQDLEFVPLQEHLPATLGGLIEATAEQRRIRMVYHTRILNLVQRYRHLLLVRVKDSRRNSILQLLGAFYEDVPSPRENLTETSPANFWNQPLENPELIWNESLFAAAKSAYDTLLNEYVILGLYPAGTQSPGFDYETLFSDRWAKLLLKKYNQRFADDTYLFEDESLRARVPVIYAKWRKAEEPLTEEEIEVWSSLRAAMREFHEVLEQIELGRRGLRSQKILESGFSQSLGRDPYDFSAALAAEQILKDVDQHPGGAYFDMFSGKGVLMHALHDLQESRPAAARRIPNGIDFTLYQADPNAEDLTVTPPGDWDKAAGLVRLEVGLDGLPRGIARLGLVNKIRILTLINVLHRMNPAEARLFFLQAAELLQDGGRLLLTLPNGIEMSASMREALFKMGFRLSPPRRGIAQISEPWLDQVEQRVLETYGDAQLARRVRANVKSTSRRRFSMIELTLNHDLYDAAQSENLSQESFKLDRPARRKKSADDSQAAPPPAIPSARPDALRTRREVLDALHQSDAGGRFQVKVLPESQLVDRAQAQDLFPEIQSENALEHLYRYREFFSDPARAHEAVRLIEENYDYWRFGTRQFRAGDMQRLRRLYVQGPEVPRKGNRLFTKEELLGLAAGRKDAPLDSVRDKLEKQLPKIQDFEVLAFAPGAYAGKAPALSVPAPESAEPSLLHLLQRASPVQPVWSVQRLASLEQFLIQRQAQPGIRRVTELLRKPPRPVVSRVGALWTNEAVWAQALEMRATPWPAYLAALQNTDWAASALEHLLPFSLYIASLYQLIRDHSERGFTLPEEEYQRVFTQLAALNHLSPEDFTQRLQTFSGSFWIDLQKLPPEMQDLIEKINDLEEEEADRERKQKEGAELGAALHQDYLQIRAFMTGFLSEQTDGFGDYGIKLMQFAGSKPERLALMEAVLDDVLMSGDYPVKRMHDLQKTVESQYLALVYPNPDLAFRVIQRMSVLTGSGNLAFGERTHLAAFAATRLSEFFDRFGLRAAVKQAFSGQDPEMILARLITNTHLRKFMDTGKERAAPEGSELLEEMSRLMRDYISNAQAPAGTEHAGLLNQMAEVKGAPAAFIESLIESRVPQNGPDQARYFEQIQIYLKKALLAAANLEDFYALAARLSRFNPAVYERARILFLTWLNFYFHAQEHRHEFVQMISELNETCMRDWAAILGFNPQRAEDFVNLNEFKYIEEVLLEAIVSDHPVAAYQAARLVIHYEQGTRAAEGPSGTRHPQARQFLQMIYEELYRRHGVDILGRMRLLAGFISEPQQDFVDFVVVLQNGILKGLEEGSFRHVFYPKLERFLRVWSVRAVSEKPVAAQPPIFSDLIQNKEMRRKQYEGIVSAEAKKIGRYHGRQAVTTWLRGHMYGFDREKGRFPNTAAELVNWAAGTSPSFPLEQFPGHMLGGEPAVNPLMGVVEDAFRGFFDLNHAIDEDMQHLGGQLARQNPDAKLYPNFWVWLKDPMNEHQEIAMGATYAVIKPDGEAVIYIYTKDHPDPVISSHDPYFYRREVQDLIMALGHLTRDEAFVKRQGFKKARFVLLLEGMDFLRKDRPPLPEGVALEWVADLPAAPPSPVRIEANFYDPKTRRFVSGSELGSADYKLADVAQRIHDAYTARIRAFVKASRPQRADEKMSVSPLGKLDESMLNDMAMIQWTFGEKAGARRPPLWTLDAEERAAIEAFVHKLLEAPTREERGLWGNLLELVRRKGFAANAYARFYFVTLALSGSYDPAAVEQGMRSLDHIFLGHDFYEPAGPMIEQLLALQDALSDPVLPEALRRMLQGYFTFLFSNHLNKSTFETWAEQHPGNDSFGDYLSLQRGSPAGIRGDDTQTQLLQNVVNLVKNPDDRAAAKYIRDILKSPTYQQAIIPLLVQYSEKTSHAPRGMAPKMTESKIRPVTQIMFEPAVPFKVLIDYFHYARGIYAVWHRQYDYDSSVMRWFLGDLWGEIDRRLGAGEVSENEFIHSIFGHYWAQDTLIQLMGPEPVVLSHFGHVRRIILNAMTGPDPVLSGRAFNFVSQLQQAKVKEKDAENLARRLDGDDLLLRDAFIRLFEREGFSALPFQIIYSLTPASRHVRAIFPQAAEAFIDSRPAAEHPLLRAAFAQRSRTMAALAGNTDFPDLRAQTAEHLQALKKRTHDRVELSLDSFSPALRARVQGLVRDIFEAPNEWVQQNLAEQLKQLNDRGADRVYAEFETSLAIMRQRLLGSGRTIEQIETAQTALFRAGLDPQTTVLQRLKPEALQKLEVEFYVAIEGRSEDELRDAALAFYYFSLLAGQSYKGRRTEYPLQNRFDADLNLMQSAISEIQEGMRKGTVLQTAGELYQKVIAHYGFQNLEALKTILHYLRVTHDEEWAELFLKTLEEAVRESLRAGQTLNAAEINGWIMAELANHNWPKRRVLKILGMDAEGLTRFDRLFPKVEPQPAAFIPVAKPIPKPKAPSEPPAWEPPPAEDGEPALEPAIEEETDEETYEDTDEESEDESEDESEGEPPVVIIPPAPKPAKLKPVEPSKHERAAAVLAQFDEILQKTPDEFKSLARSQQEGGTSIAEEFGRAVGFLLFSQARGAGDDAANAKRFRAFELALRHFDTVLNRLDDFELTELFEQIWAKIPSEHPGAWFREETLSPERMLELENLTFGTLQSIPDFFDYLAYDRSRPESYLRSGYHAPITRLEELLQTPENRQAFREKMQSNYFVPGVWSSPFLFSEELKVFDQNNLKFKNIRETFLEMAHEHDPRTAFFIHDGFMTLHHNRSTTLVPDQPADIKEGLRRFHADFLVTSGYLAYLETRTSAAGEGNAGAQEFVRSFFTPQILSVLRYAVQQQSGPALVQIRQIVLVLQRQLPEDAGGAAAHKILGEIAKKRSEMRRTRRSGTSWDAPRTSRSEMRHLSAVVTDTLLFERTPENGMLDALLRVVREGRVSQLAGEMFSSSVGAGFKPARKVTAVDSGRVMPLRDLRRDFASATSDVAVGSLNPPLQNAASGTASSSRKRGSTGNDPRFRGDDERLSKGIKAWLLDRLMTAPAGLDAMRPAGLSVPAQPVISDSPLVWVSSKLPELAALKTFVRENPAAHVLILLLPSSSMKAKSMRVQHFSAAEFPQIKIAAPETRVAFRRILHNVSAEFGRTFGSEPVFVLNAEVKDRPEFEDIALAAEKAIEYSASWQGSIFLPHHYLLLLDAAKLSQDLDLAYGQRENSAKRWYLFDERRVNATFLSDLGKFLSAQLSFTASA